MKQLHCTLFFYMFCASLLAWTPSQEQVKTDGFNTTSPPTRPEKIYAFTRVLHTLDYYVEQAGLWKSETEQTPQNPDAWLNYYQAARIANVFSAEKKPFDLDAIYQNIEKHVPNTFEYHYLTYDYYGGSSSYFEHLEKAYHLDPNRTETYTGMIRHYELLRNTEKVNYFCQKWYNSQEFSPGIFAWNYNMFMSLEEDAILITQGDNDTYPLWMLQHAKGERTDVSVINIHLLSHTDYRDALFQENDIPSFPNEAEDFASMMDYYLAISHHILEYSQKPAYLGITVYDAIRQQDEEHLYLVGLALKYAKDNFDNTAVLKDNFENRFLTDHLKVNFEDDVSISVLNQMNLSYIPALMVLHEHYLKNNQLIKAKELEDMSTRIGIAGNPGLSIQHYIQSQIAQYRRVESILDLKSIEKSMQPVHSKLWAMETELTNQAYEEFLMDLLKNKEFAMLDSCKTTKTDWRALLPIYHKLVNDKTVFLHGHPDDAETPVQNISYEAAQLYCHWLTNVYNNSNHKKKRFSKVQFRLPTEKEWENAAYAGRDTIAPYPWGGYYSRNAKGCYLSNFYVSEELPCETCDASHPSSDGGFFTVRADAYFPNDFGLYGMSGNVAEMVAEKGIAKGGSWEDPPQDCTIKARKPYAHKSPAIGFRVFMEIIE